MNGASTRGGTGALVSIAFRNIFRNFRRTIFCVAAVGVAVFFIVVYSSFIAGMLRSMREVVQIFDLGHVRAVSARYEAESEYSPVHYPVAEGQSLAAVTERIRTIPGVRAVFPRISAYATLQESLVKHAALWGITMREETAANHFNLTDRNDGLL